MTASNAGALPAAGMLDRSSKGSRPREVRRVANRDILPQVAAGVLATLASPLVRRRFAKALWIELKRHGARSIENIEVSRLRGIDQLTIDGPVLRKTPLVLAALASVLDCERIFEFGTFRGDTAWLLAHNLARAQVFTLDLAGPQAVREATLELTDPEYFATWDRGSRFRGTPEAERITQLLGDSATFDFSGFRGSMDLVYIDASHSYSYVKSDTEAALGMLSETGTIAWDDYTHYPGIYAYLHELAPTLDRPIYHVLSTRLALYSRRDVVLPER